MCESEVKLTHIHSTSVTVEVKLTHTRSTSVTVYPCGPRTKAVAMGAWLHLTPWKRRIGPHTPARAEITANTEV